MNRSFRPLGLFLAAAGTALTFLSGCAAPSAPSSEPLIARFFLEAHASEEGRPVTLPQSGVTITILPKPVVMEFDLVDADVAEVSLGQCLLFKLTPAAAQDLYRLTGTSQGRRLVLALNDTVIGARRIDRPFDDGTIATFVEVPDATLPELAMRLKATSADIRRTLSRER